MLHRLLSHLVVFALLAVLSSAGHAHDVPAVWETERHAHGEGLQGQADVGGPGSGHAGHAGHRGDCTGVAYCDAATLAGGVPVKPRIANASGRPAGTAWKSAPRMELEPPPPRR